MADSSKHPSGSFCQGTFADGAGNLQGKQTLTDKDLVVAYQAGDRGAYDAIYDRHRERVRRICYRMLGNNADAEEAAQETFLRTYKALGRFNGQYQLAAWVSRVASNVCLDQLRLRGRSVRTEDVDEEAMQLACPDKLPDLVVEQQIDVAESLKSIRPLHARALMLRAVAGLSHTEIASELDMTPEQVKSLLHRARTSFRRVWDQASGWALAPLAPLGLRLPFTKKEGAPAGDGINLIAASPMTSTLVERVAASAMIAALALTGVGAVTAITTPSTPPTAVGPGLPREAEAEKLQQPGRADNVHNGAPSEAAGRGNEAPRRAGRDPKADPVLAFGGVIVQRPKAPSAGQEEQLDLTTAGSSGADDARRKLDQTVETVKEASKEITRKTSRTMARPAASSDG